MNRPPFDEGAQALTQYLWRHYGSHERPAVLDRWCTRLPRGVVAQLLPDVWTGRNEKVGQSLDPQDWELLFEIAMPQPATVSVPLTVYRAGNIEGMSWTTDRWVAERFAERGDILHEFTITDRQDVLAVFDDRNEHEVGATSRRGRTLVTNL